MQGALLMFGHPHVFWCFPCVQHPQHLYAPLHVYVVGVICMCCGGNTPYVRGLGAISTSVRLLVSVITSIGCPLCFTVCQAVMGATQACTSKVYQQCWKEWVGWCAWQGVLNNAISGPKLANCLVHLFQVGLAWHTIGNIILLFLPFWSLIVFTRLLIILLFQNKCVIFIYSILLINILILGMLSICYLCWKVGHPLLLSLPLNLLGRLLLF